MSAFAYALIALSFFVTPAAAEMRYLSFIEKAERKIETVCPRHVDPVTCKLLYKKFERATDRLRLAERLIARYSSPEDYNSEELADAIEFAGRFRESQLDLLVTLIKYYNWND